MSTRPALTTADQRATPRKFVNWRARLMRADGSLIDCRAVNSSLGGVGLISEMAVLVGERVQVALQVPDERTGRLSVAVHAGVVAANVLTSGGYRIGIKLADRLQDLLGQIGR